MTHPHFRAHIKVRSTEDGGRQTPIHLSGYRPDLSFQLDRKSYYGVHLVSEEGFEKFGDEKLAPGAERDVDFWVRSAATHIMPQLKTGMAFRMMEGGRPVADGTIVTIYRLDE